VQKEKAASEKAAKFREETSYAKLHPLILCCIATFYKPQPADLEPFRIHMHDIVAGRPVA